MHKPQRTRAALPNRASGGKKAARADADEHGDPSLRGFLATLVENGVSEYEKTADGVKVRFHAGGPAPLPANPSDAVSIARGQDVASGAAGGDMLETMIEGTLPMPLEHENDEVP